ncbi:hypothetical protein B0H16DRAFT_1889520 [Mycena metata]|uniref:Uncharacterized protein n=1 Tax=Mycena metata TaxID=1033252 RepID=A0AAD7IMQ5_9AGAR|nr:hypothetical protein B0H16DRAFT_1889520 [Mycena metata]
MARSSGATAADAKRTRKPSEKAKAAQKKKKKSSPDSSEDSEDDAPKPKAKASTASKTTFEIDWKKYPDLSVKLLAHIYETVISLPAAVACASTAWIKQSLYPPPGPNASTTDSGGTPKTQAHWVLALLLLEKDSKYKDALKACKTPKEQLSVGNKIKNRLDVMQKLTKKYNDEMGETGAAEISAACPWYFEMRNLMGQRPNLVPTGLGHSNSAVSADVIMPGAAAETEMEMEPATDADGNNGDGAEGDREEEDIMGNDNDDTSSTHIDWSPSPFNPDTLKRSSSTFDDDVPSEDYKPSSPSPSEPITEGEGDDEEVVPTKPKTKKRTAKPATSKRATPAPAPAAKATKKTKLAEFSEIAKTEEKTRQKEIELAILRTRREIAATEVKGRIIEKREQRLLEKEKGKREERMMKLKLKQEQMRNSHELRMATATGSGVSSRSHAGDSFFDSRSHSSGSRHTPSESAVDYSSFNGLSGFDSSAFAGPSQSMANNDFTDLNNFADSASMGGFIGR